MKNKLILSTVIAFFCGVCLYAQPKATSSPKVIAEMNEPLRLPVWSPDGSKIAMTSIGNNGIWTVNKDGTNFQRLTTDPGVGYKLQWSADNSSILARTSFTENNRIHHEVKVYHMEGTEEVIVPKTRSLKGLPYWSKDHSQVLYKIENQLTSSKKIKAPVSSEPTVNKENTLFNRMIESPAEIASQIAGLEELKSYIIFNPVLSPSGTKIVFQTNNGKGMYVCNVDGSGLKNLGIGERASWTPDEKYIIVSVTEDNGYVVTKGTLQCIDINSGNKSEILNSEQYIAVTPAISPDGTRLAFEDYKSGSIYVMDLK